MCEGLNTQLSSAYEEYQRGRYTKSIYLFYIELYSGRPESKEITEQSLLDKNFFVSLAERTYKIRESLCINDINKATILLGICINLNNFCSGMFIPYSYENVRLCLRCQSVCIDLYEYMIRILNQNKFMISIKDLNVINYTYAVMEANLGVVMLSYPDNRVTVKGKDFIENGLNKIDKLIKVDPQGLYFRTKSKFLLFLNKRKESNECIQQALDSDNEGVSLEDLSTTLYRSLLTAKHQVVLYK